MSGQYGGTGLITPISPPRLFQAVLLVEGLGVKLSLGRIEEGTAVVMKRKVAAFSSLEFNE